MEVWSPNVSKTQLKFYEVQLPQGLTSFVFSTNLSMPAVSMSLSAVSSQVNLSSPTGLITGRAVSVTVCCHLETRKRAANWLFFSFKYRTCCVDR